MPIKYDQFKKGNLIIEFEVDFPDYVESNKKEMLKKTLKV